MKWADLILCCHYLWRASSCTWHKERAQRNNGSIVVIKMSSFCQNQTPKQANKLSYEKVGYFQRKSFHLYFHLKTYFSIKGLGEG